MSTAVKNWFGAITSSPSTVVEVRTVDEIVAIVKDAKKGCPFRYEHNHSTTACRPTTGP